MMRAIIVAVVAGGILAGCAQVFFHAAGSHRYPAKPENCHIRVVAAPPGSEFEEIGLLSVEGDHSAFRNPDAFIEEAREVVCHAGGEVVLTQVNGIGAIVRGVVFRRSAAQPATEETTEECNPICSPGFDCKGTKCVPLCNPACEDGESCGRDRLCHPRAGSSQE
jgi:hypothetical protein